MSDPTPLADPASVRAPASLRGQTDAQRSTAWIDNHCHLGSGSQRSRSSPASSELLAEARTNGVIGFIDVAVDLDSARRSLALANREPDVWATVGVHPHTASQGLDGIEALVAENLAGGPLVAIGECGLDFHYDHSPREVQREVFARQIGLANRVGLPLVIHTREAWEETFAVLDTEGVPARTVFHCFTGGPPEAREALSRGALISVSGIVTFPSATDLADAVRQVPTERLMVETDSPYLAPVPHRGHPNRPALIGHVGSRVAELKEVPVVDLSAATVANTVGFYSLELPG